MNYEKTTKSISIAVLGLLVVGCSGATCAGLAGCSGDTFSIPDSGDAAEDAAFDAGGDAASDDADAAVADDALVEASTDAGIDAAPSDKRVFITSSRTTSNFGSLVAADAICQAAATGAALGGSWKAWLSTATTSAASRLAHSATAYRLVDGTLVAQDWNHLVSGAPLKNPIDLDENGNFVPGTGQNGYAWTGTEVDGGAASLTCGDWSVSEDCSTTTAFEGVVGFDTFTTSAWTSGGNPACCTVQKFAFYCFEQ